MTAITLANLTDIIPTVVTGPLGSLHVTGATTTGSLAVSGAVTAATATVSGTASISTITATLVSTFGTTTSPFTGDAAQISSSSQPSGVGKTANEIYRMTSFLDFANYDAIRGVATAVSGSTVTNVTGIAGYVLNQIPTSISGQNSVAVFGIGIGSADNSATWGFNSVLTDNTSYAVSTGTGKTIIGAEFDHNIMSSGTHVRGILLTGASLAQPASSFAVNIENLQYASPTYPWDVGLRTGPSACTVGIELGYFGAFSGANVPSQQLRWDFTNIASAAHYYSVAVDTQNILTLGASTTGYFRFRPGTDKNLLVQPNNNFADGVTLVSANTANNTLKELEISSSAIRLSTNVGIGKTAAVPLDVLGAGAFSGGLSVGSTVTLTGQTSTPGFLTGTLTNAPATGNPQTWLSISINGVVHFIPAWHV